jgi:excinuclease ABC subunit A
MLEFSKGTRFVVMAPIHLHEGRTMEQQLKTYQLEGYARIYVDGDFQRIDDYLGSYTSQASNTSDTSIYLVIDRLSVDDTKDVIARLVDSAETAFYEGHGELRLLFPPTIFYDFSMKFEADGITFEEPSDQMFSFNSPAGACPECQGFGRIIGIDEKLVIPNSTLSVYDGCVVCWHGERY